MRSYVYAVKVLTYVCILLRYVYPMGFYGSTYTSNLKTLKTLGIEHAAADTISRKTS